MTSSQRVMRYNPKAIEAKWQKRWAKDKTYEPDLKKAKKPFYNLMMFPYPSAEGLHVGNVYAFTGSDIHGRFERMRENDVFEPMGFDSFGIHSENFAIKMGTHPKAQMAKNITHFTEQLKQLGALFDWSRAVTTSEPEYYKWTQWPFLQNSVGPRAGHRLQVRAVQQPGYAKGAGALVFPYYKIRRQAAQKP